MSKIYLASSSPRRAELLRQIGMEFVVLGVDVNENRKPGESARQYVCRIARIKAEAGARRLVLEAADYRVIGADTTIVLDGDIMGKPADRSACRCMLERLSARQHQVLTAVALATPTGIEQRLSRSEVSFRRLTSAEIEAYCAGTEPMDKAGAYAIQGRAAVFIERLEGSYSGVMGLPIFETAELLQASGLKLFERDDE